MPVRELSRLRKVLRDYRAHCEEYGLQPKEPSVRLNIDAKDVERLEALGYM